MRPMRRIGSISQFLPTYVNSMKFLIDETLHSNYGNVRRGVTLVPMKDEGREGEEREVIVNGKGKMKGE